MMSSVKGLGAVFLALSVFVAAAGPAQAEEKPDPADVLKKAEAALKQAKVVRYKFVREGLKADAEKSPKITGTVVMSGWYRMFPKRFRLDAVSQQPGATDTEKLTAGSDGDVFYWFDEKSKKVHADMDPGVFGSRAQSLFDLVVGTYANPDPFEYEKKAGKIEYKGTSKVGDEECHEIHFVFGEHFEANYFFSIKDSLLKKFEWTFAQVPGEWSGSRVVLSEVTLDYRPEGDPFKLTVPEGFTKTDEFAP